jgi:hypothetical protein
VNGIYKNVSVLIGSDAIAEVTENGMRPAYPTGAETLNGIGLNA